MVMHIFEDTFGSLRRANKTAPFLDNWRHFLNFYSSVESEERRRSAFTMMSFLGHRVLTAILISTFWRVNILYENGAKTIFEIILYNKCILKNVSCR